MKTGSQLLQAPRYVPRGFSILHYPGHRYRSVKSSIELIALEMVLALTQVLSPYVDAQIEEAQRLGLSNRRIYSYYSELYSSIGTSWDRKWRDASRFWISGPILAITTYLVDQDDEETLDKHGEMKPSIVVKALAIAVKEL